MRWNGSCSGRAHMSFRLLSLALAAAACGGGGASPTPDANAPDAGIDAPAPERPLRSPPTRMIISRGAPGAETLYAISSTGEVVLSDALQAPWCGGKPFCNLPPDGTIGRYAGVQWVGDDRAFYVDLDLADWANLRVVSVDLATGARTQLAEALDVVRETPDWPLFYVVSTAVAGDTIWLSLPVAGGMALYRTDGRSPIVEVARTPTPSGLTYMESHVDATAAGVAWSVRWRRGVAHEDPYAYVTRIFDASGATLLRVPEDITGAVDGSEPSRLVDGVATVHWQRAGGELVLERFDLASRTRTAMPVTNGIVYPLAPGGHGVFHVFEGDYLAARIVDATTGAVLDAFEGLPWATTPTSTLYRTFEGALRERVRPSGVDRELAPGTSLMLDAMAGRHAPDGTKLAVGSGAPFSDLSDNVGIELVDLETLARTAVEPAETSEHFVRRMQFTPDGAWLVYLHPVDGVLQLAGYELATGARATFTTGTEDVRQLVMSPTLEE